MASIVAAKAPGGLFPPSWGSRSLKEPKRKPLMSYSRSAPGPWATLAIVAVVTVLTLADRRRLKRARLLNEEGRCARCGAVLVGPAHRVPIAGGPRFVSTAYACDDCRAAVRRREWLVWSFLGAVLVVVLFLEWKRTHP
jgi:hypothetical protein